MNAWVFQHLLGGLYRLGLMPNSKQQYETAYAKFSASLLQLDEILAARKFLSNQATPQEPDFFAFVELVKYETALYYLWPPTCRKLISYKNIWRWLADVAHYRNIKETVDFNLYRKVYLSKEKLNPGGEVPDQLDLEIIKHLQ